MQVSRNQPSSQHGHTHSPALPCLDAGSAFGAFLWLAANLLAVLTFVRSRLSFVLLGFRLGASLLALWLGSLAWLALSLLLFQLGLLHIGPAKIPN